MSCKHQRELVLGTYYEVKMTESFITKSLECLYDEQNYGHTLYIPRNYNKNIYVISSTINTIYDMINML